MKLFRLMIILSLLAVAVPSVSAAGPAGSWASGISCTNLGNATTTLTLAFYKQDGTIAVSYTDNTHPVDAGKTQGYFTPSSFPTLPADYVGSAVVSATQPLACNVNTQTTGTGTVADPLRIGTSAGFSDTQAAAKMFVPQVVKAFSGGWNSYVAVQNTSGADVQVQISYRDRFGAAVPAATENRTIKGYSNTVFYQADNALLPTSGSGFVGSAIVEATSPNTTKLGVTVNMYNVGSNNTTAQFQSYNGAAEVGGASTVLYAPRFVRNFSQGYNGGMVVQNVGATATHVKITFTFANGGGTYVFNTSTGHNGGNPIQPGAALFLYATAGDLTSLLAPIDTKPNNQRYGNAKIESLSSNKIVAIVNEDNRGGAGVPVERVGNGMTYNAVPDGAQTLKLIFPQVPSKAGAYSGGMQIMNTTGTASTCTINFTDAIGASATWPLDANGTIGVFAPSFAATPGGTPTLVPNGYNKGVVVTCGQPVVGIANFTADPGSGKLGDSLTTSTGLNVTP